jgi:hypothetical protein
VHASCPEHPGVQVTVLHPAVESEPHCAPTGQPVGQHVPALHVNPPAHPPQLIVPTHPSDTLPHCRAPQATLLLSCMHMHAPGVPGDAPHTNGSVHPGVQFNVVQPGVGSEPQSSPNGQLVGHIVLMH